MLAAGALALGVAAPALAEAPYLCSGTSEEERMEAEATTYTLKLVYAEPGGSYLGDVSTQIADSSGQVLVDTTCRGPWLLADLPGGQYDDVRVNHE